MKIYNEKKEEKKKSWSIRILEMAPCFEPCISAVDSVTGNHIVTLMEFCNNGRLKIREDVPKILVGSGYDPNENGTQWSSRGGIVVEFLHKT